MSAAGRLRALLHTGSVAAVRVAVYVIQLYRHLVSPLRPASCRFVPTCSHYAVDALTEYGLVRGGCLAVARLAKCGPWHPGGWDPIPERPNFKDASGAGSPPATRGESESLV